MMEILGIISGYMMVVLGIGGVLLLPVAYWSEQGVRAYLNHFSEGLIKIKQFKLFESISNNCLCEILIGCMLTSVSMVVWFIISFATLISVFKEGLPVETVSLKIIGVLYIIGDFLAPFILLVGVIVGFSQALKFVCRGVRKASDALEAVKQHEKSKH